MSDDIDKTVNRKGLPSRTKSGECHHFDAKCLAQIDKILLNVVRMHLDLADGRRDLGVSHQISKQLSTKIADSNILGELESRQLLHGSPGFLYRPR